MKIKKAKGTKKCVLKTKFEIQNYKTIQKQRNLIVK